MRLLLLLGAFTLAGCQKVDPTPPIKAAEPAGRYVVTQSHEGHDDLLIDTATGKTWVSRRFAQHGDRVVWLAMNRLDSEPEVENFLNVLAERKTEKPGK